MMRSFFCRVMTLVFLINCCVPATGWGQTSRRPAQNTDTQVARQVIKTQQANSPAAAFARADTAARNAHHKHFTQTDKQAFHQSVAAHQTYTATPGSVRVERPLMPFLCAPKDFLKRVEKGEIPFEKLIDYADPLDPADNNLTIMTSASEMIGNTVSQLASLDEAVYDLSGIKDMLPQLEARLLYRLALLGDKAPSYSANTVKDPASKTRTALQAQYGNSIQKTMAVSTLRLTLLKIHQFYQTKGLADPADEYQKQALARRLAQQAKQQTQAISEGQRTFDPNPAPAAFEKQAAKQVAQNGNLASFQKNFIAELKQAVAQKPDEGSVDFQHLQVLAEYATAYALAYQPEALKDIVKTVDDGVKRTISGKIQPGKFHRKYSPILNAIFVTIFENTRYSTMGADETKKILTLLKDFSDPQQYSLPTRIFALEAASLLYRPFNKETLNQFNRPRTGFFPVNFNKPDENLRAMFAARATSIYCPLTAADYKDYGLSSKEMQALADKLAYIYDGFYDISSATIHMPGQDPHQYPAGCTMVMKNQPNRMKKDAEMRSDIFWFSLNLAFWTYGGELFSYLGTAYRLTRGATAALPKAYQAFKKAEALNAAKALRFNEALKRGRTGLELAGKEIKDGAKFSNFVGKNINQQGYTIEFLTRQAPGKTAVRAATSVESQATYQPVNSWRALQGKGSRLNPKNWFGQAPEREILGVRMTRMEPGFQVTQGEMRFGEMVNGHFVEGPISGFKSMEEVENMLAQLKQADGTRFIYQTKPYWTGILDMNQVGFEQRMIRSFEQALKNQTNTWIKMEEGAQLEGAQIGKAGNWWNFTQWGKLPAAADDIANTSMYITPKTPLEWVRGLARGVKSPNLRANLENTFPGLYSGATLYPAEGIANIPGILPGISTTGADVLTGNVARQMFDSFFKPMNWNVTPMSSRLIGNGNKWTKALESFNRGLKYSVLPDYIPTANFWRFVKANPVLGAQLVPQLLWRNRFAATTALFGAWLGADYLLYPPFKGWVEKEASQEMKQEIAKYGDTFSPRQDEKDKKVLEILGSGASTDTRAMNLYNSVLEAQPEQKEGTLIAAPIVVTRHVLGKTAVGEALGLRVNFITEAQKAATSVQARQIDLNRTWYRQQAFATIQNEALMDAESLIIQTKWLYPAELVTEEIQAHIRQIYSTYAQEIYDALGTADEQARNKKADQKLFDAQNRLWENLNRSWADLNSRQGYGPDFDFNAAEEAEAF